MSASKVFDSHKSLALVSDESTKHYFSTILANLGIKNHVRLETFESLTRDILQLHDNFALVSRHGTLDPQILFLLWKKAQLLVSHKKELETLAKNFFQN